MNDKIKSAAERLRRVRSGEDVIAIYHPSADGLRYALLRQIEKAYDGIRAVQRPDEDPERPAPY